MINPAVILTGPSLGLHLALQWIACRLLRIELRESPSLFRESLAHDAPGSLTAALLLVLPALALLILGLALLMAAGLAWHLAAADPLTPVGFYLGMVLMIQGFPFREDGRNLASFLARKPAAWLLLLLLFIPLAMARGRRFGLHFAAGLAGGAAVILLTW